MYVPHSQPIYPPTPLTHDSTFKSKDCRYSARWNTSFSCLLRYYQKRIKTTNSISQEKRKREIRRRKSNHKYQFKTNHRKVKMAHIIKIEELEVSSIDMSLPKDNQNNQGKSIFLNFHQKPLRIQTPKVKVPFGVSPVTDPKTKKLLKYALSLSFQNNAELETKFTDIERKFFQHANRNSPLIFGVRKSSDTVKEFFKTNINPSPFHELTEKQQERAEKYPRSLSTKLERKMNKDGSTSQEFTVSIFVGNKKPYEQVVMTEENYDTVIPKGSEVRAILSCKGWIVDKKFGITWRVEQLQVFPNMNKLVGFSFVGGGEEEGGNDDQEEQDDIPKQEKDGEDSHGGKEGGLKQYDDNYESNEEEGSGRDESGEEEEDDL